ncbi:MAG: protein translocase subunit SecF [Pseudomonadales bacterium]|nr:protein translocase subunit SecF [Pseudomonadales bacterium]
MQNINTIDFMGKRKAAIVFSCTLILISLVSFVVNGMKFGLDFTGGTQIEVAYSEPVVLDDIRAILSDGAYQNFEVVFFGSEQDVLVRIQETAESQGNPEQAGQTGERVAALMQAASSAEVQLLRSEYVGSVVGEELREQGGLGMLVALIMIMIYIAMRFQFKFAVGAVVALAHDVIITLGFFSVMQYDFDLTVLAGLLAVIGYSLNDTIVVFDRIRENFRVLRKMEVKELINVSITVTLSRTIITSGTTLMVLVALFLVGGESVRGFSMALIVGIGIGTYSSIFVAANVLVHMQVSKEDLMPPARDDEALDSLP